MATLADVSARIAERDRRVGLLAKYAAERNVDPHLWALMPYFGMVLTGFIEGPDRLSAATSARAVARNLARARSAGKGPSIRKQGSVLLASTSRQNLRVLDPVATAIAADLGAPSVPLWSPVPGRALAHAHRRSANIVADLGYFLEGYDVRLPAGVAEEVFQTAIMIERSRLLLDRQGISVLVVASQHNSASRAMLAAAHALGSVTTVYLPHAPVADVFYYDDLPTHVALLRGPAEIDYYQKVGSSVDGLHAVGDPSLQHWPPPTAPYRPEVVFAVSAYPEERLDETIAVVRDAGLTAVEVAPHPRMDREALQRRCPDSWTFNPAPSTYARLVDAGAAAVIQDSSGLGLEALALGLPVIDLCAPGAAPLYPFISPPGVEVVEDSDALRRAVERAERSPAAAETRREFASSWSVDGSDGAASACADVVRSLLDAGERAGTDSALILDAWG